MSKTLDAFTRAYLETALWSSSCDWEGRDDVPMDDHYSPADIAPETLAKMQADCERFQRENQGDLDAGPDRYGPDYGPVEHGGHDFWLTRHGHGAGFWDGDWPEPAATRLTDSAHKFGEFNLYVGDDGLIYGS